MTPQETESELSYAYLHAVAAAAGVACMQAGRGHDNNGIDAMLTLRRDFGEHAKLTDATIHVQLKATTQLPAIRADGARSYFLKSIAEYDRLRRPSSLPPRLLVVLFLPDDSAQWIRASADELVLQRAAYWTSLHGAPPSDNASGCTVYLPASQRLSPDGLQELFRRIAHLEDVTYEH